MGSDPRDEVAAQPSLVEALEAERASRRSAEELAATLERMLGIVGHELRNPLGAVLLATTTLQRQALKSDHLRTIDQIAISASRMRRMINQLLDFAAIRQGRLQLNRRASDLRLLTQMAVDELKASFPGSAIEVSAKGKPTGRWDPDRITDVMANLIRNALQHGSDLRASVRLQGGKDGVTVAVNNAGRPIPPQALASIFDPFRQLFVRSRPARSVGLGLFIVKSIVEAHDGSIKVESDEKSGTTFTVFLPA